MGGKSGERGLRAPGRLSPEGWGRSAEGAAAQPMPARVRAEWAGGAGRAGSGLTHLALVPGDPRRGAGGGGRGERGEGARAQWRGEERGPGSGLRGCERAANPAGGWRAHHGGETRDQVREVGPRGETWAAAPGGYQHGLQTRTQGERIQSRTLGSLGGSHLGPHAYVLEDNEGDACQGPCRKRMLKEIGKPASGFSQGCGGRTLGSPV